MTTINVTYTATRTTTLQSYRGNWYAEALIQGWYIADASGDTREEAIQIAQGKIAEMRVNPEKERVLWQYARSERKPRSRR